MNSPATNTVNLAELKKKAKLPARQAGGSTVKEFFEANKAAMAAVLPKHVSPERMLRLALTAMRAVPKLTECTVESLMGAVMQCAQLGLEPNTPLGYAYMIPFRDNRNNRTDVQLVIGYRGLIDLARRSGQIVSIAAHEVCERDEFQYQYGLEETLVHRPAEGDRGEVTHFYAVAKLKDGGHAFEVMSRAQVERIRDNSQNYKWARDKSKTVWGQYFIEMGRKTVIRRLFKYLPVSIEIATASALDAMAESGKPQGLDGVLTGDYQVLDDEAIPVPHEDTAAPEADDDGLWPRQDDEGRWFDSAGEVYDPERHGWSRENDRPSVTAEGRFRARRKRRDQAASEPAQQPDSPQGSGDNQEWLEGYDGGDDAASGLE